MSDPISRLEFAQREIDRVFGGGHAVRQSLVVAVLNAASSDWAAFPRNHIIAIPFRRRCTAHRAWFRMRCSIGILWPAPKS